MKPRKARSSASAPAMPFVEFAAACDPRQWRLKCVSVRLDGDGPPHRTTLPWPPDRDLAAALAASGAPPGTYSVAPIPATRGESGVLERQRIGLAEYQRIATGVVQFGRADVEAAGAQHRRAPGAPIEDPEIAQARKQAELAKHEAARAASLAAARKAERNDGGDLTALVRTMIEQQQQQQQRGGSSDLAAVLAMMQSQQQQNQALLLAMLEQSRNEKTALIQALHQQQTTRTLPELGEVARTISVFKELREMMQQPELEPAEPRPWWAELVPVMLQRLTTPPPGAAPPAEAPPAAPAAAPAIAAPPTDLAAASQRMQQERVAEWLHAVILEAINGSDPEDLADRLADSVGGLPADLRAGLDAGETSTTLAAVRRYLTPEQIADLDPFLARESVAAWVAEFVVAHRLEPDNAR